MPDPVTTAAPLPAAPIATTTAAVAGLGTALPATVVGNDEIAARLGVEPDWIVQRTGIRERRFAAPGETLTDLAAAAAEASLAAAGIDAADLDLVLVATLTADDLLPNAAPLVADAIGARGAFACDVGAACTGFLSGLSLAAAQIESGRAGHALVVGADLLSRVTDRDDRKTAGLFADAAGAMVLGAGGPGSIDRIILRSDARHSDCIVAASDERLIRMRGQDTFRAAVDRLSEITVELLDAEGLELGDVDVFVYHQANGRIIRAVGERLGLPAASVIDCIERYGNTSAATLPLALAHAASSGLLASGDRVLLAAFGAGFTWGAGSIVWDGGAGR